MSAANESPVPVEPEGDRHPTAATGRRRRWPRRLLAAAVVFALAGWAAVAWIERSAAGYFAAGQGAVTCLHRLAEAVRRGDRAELERLYAPAFAGRALGLGRLAAGEEKDGLRVSPFAAPDEPADRAAAIAEWRRYSDSFTSIDEVQAHVERIEQWGSGAVVASVRFELIGTPRGATRPAVDRATLRMRFEPAADGGDRLVIQQAAPLAGHRAAAERPHFVEVGARAGIDFVNRVYPRFLDDDLTFPMLRYGPAGITTADYDNDGFHDLFIPDGVASRLFRNRGDGTFEDVTGRAGLAGLDGVSVALFADYDNDGWKDLFVSRTFEPNQLFRNRGDGTFEDVTLRAGIGADCCTTVAAWADYDGDGFLDLYVGRYLDPHREIPTTFYARNGLPDQLYRNEGDGTFTNVTVEAGVGDVGLCLGAVWGDYDDDGDPDLYVVNDFGRNTLYRNEGDGTFRDVTQASGTLAYGAGMSASFGDFDNDGTLDVYVANIRSDHRWFAEWPMLRLYLLNAVRQGMLGTDWPVYREIHRQSGFAIREVFQQMGSGNTLLRGNGDGTFEDVTWQAGANPPGWFWGSGFADFDNDGWLDVYSANGWVYAEKGTDFELDFFHGVVNDHRRYKAGWFFDPDNWGGRSWHGWERNRHLRNEGDGTFTEIGTPAGSGLLLNSRGTAVADFRNRGVLDIAVAASTDRHALLENRVGTARNWLVLELTGAAGDHPLGTNRDAVGARVVVEAGGLRQLREVVLGDGYGSQNTLRQHFGLGDASSAERVTVTWPRSGRRQTFRDVAAGRIYRLTEGEDSLVPWQEEPAEVARHLQ